MWDDVRYAVRQLRKRPMFTAVTILTLATGIAINATVSTLSNAVLFSGFPGVSQSDRVVYIDTRRGDVGCCVSYPDFQDWQAEATSSFAAMAVVSNGGLRIRLSDQSGAPETADVTELSAGAFGVLGQKPLLGRDFAESDAAAAATPVAILGHGFWVRRYGSDPSVIGRTVRLDNVPTVVIGVMPTGFAFPHHRVDLWIPLVLGRAPVGARGRDSQPLQQRQARVLWFAFGRLARGASITSARTELNTIGHRLASAYPVTNDGYLPVVMTFHEFFIGSRASLTYGLMWGAVGFVFLIACANFASLLLARAGGRSREISVRVALGATRWRIIRQLLVESELLSAAAGALGIWVAIVGVRVFELMANPPDAYDRWTYTMDDRVLAYLVAISVGAGLLCGLAPAGRLLGLSTMTALREGAHGGTPGRRGKRFSGVLMAAEMTLTVVLLAGAGVLIRSFSRIYRANLGVNKANLVTASVRLPAERYAGVDVQLAFFNRLTDRLGVVPEVESVAVASSLPGLYTSRVAYEIDGALPADQRRPPELATVFASPAYFRTVQASVLQGRPFSESDGTQGVPVAIVNQRLASMCWPGRDPLGKHLRPSTHDSAAKWITVVGVASNIVQNDPTGQRFDPVVYLPFRQRAAEGTVIVRLRGGHGNVAAVVRREIEALDSSLVIGSGNGSIEGPKRLVESLAFNYWSNGLNGALFAIFATVALLLASVGLFGVLADSMGARVHEIGIRTAIGATRRDIFVFVFREGMVPVGVGLIIGVPAAAALMPVLRSQLVQVSPVDPITLVAASLVLTASAALGCWIPSRRAMRVDPIEALRDE